MLLNVFFRFQFRSATEQFEILKKNRGSAEGRVGEEAPRTSDHGAPSSPGGFLAPTAASVPRSAPATRSPSASCSSSRAAAGVQEAAPAAVWRRWTCTSFRGSEARARARTAPGACACATSSAPPPVSQPERGQREVSRSEDQSGPDAEAQAGAEGEATTGLRDPKLQQRYRCGDQRAGGE